MRVMEETVITKTRMRSIYQSLDMLRAEDPDTAVSYGVIRDLINNIPNLHRVGTKWLSINLFLTLHP